MTMEEPFFRDDDDGNGDDNDNDDHRAARFGSFELDGGEQQQNSLWSSGGTTTIWGILVAGVVFFASLECYHRARTSSELHNIQQRRQQHEEQLMKYQSRNIRRNGRITLRHLQVSSFETETVHKTNDNPNIGSVPSQSHQTTYHYTNPQTNGGHQYFLDGSPEEFDPRIAWLASFPNSGTSFTMTLVARATNTTFATNYGIEANYGSKETPSLPIYARHLEGPYMPDPETSYHHRQLPYGHHVITKTHCGGYCVNCGPDEYAYGYDGNNDTFSAPVSFLGDCASGHAIDSNGNLVDVSYPPERVSRVIHLVRNPLHNVIARFHLERKHHSDANTTTDREWLDDHPDNHEGLIKFCAEQDTLRRQQETEFFESDFFVAPKSDRAQTSFARRNGDHRSSTEQGFPTDPQSWKDLVARVPCRGDFFRYVQWHNLLHRALDYVPHKLPVLTVYYEDYQPETFRDTADALLEFLELEPVPGDKRGNVKWTEFHSRTDYEGFFDPVQTAAIRDFLQTLASYKVWGELEHYFQQPQE